MIEIEQIVDLISQNFDKKNEQDFIMDIFILGSVFKQNKIENYEFFQYFLNQILNVRQQVNLQIISNNRIKKLYNEYYNSNEDIIQLYQQLEMEIYDEPSKIKVKQMEKDGKQNNILQNFQQNQIDFNLKQKSIKKQNDKVKDLLLESNQLGFKEHKLKNNKIKQYVETHNDEYSCCPVCLKTYCLSCKTEYHHNLTCAEYLKNQKQQELDAVYQQNQFTNNLNKLQQNQQQMISFQNPQFPNLQNQFQNLATEKNQFIKSNNYPNFHLNSYTNQYIPPQQQLQFVNFQPLQPALQNPIEKQQQFVNFQPLQPALQNPIEKQQQFMNYQFFGSTDLQQVQLPPLNYNILLSEKNKYSYFNQQNHIETKNNGLNQQQLDDKFLNLMMISKYKQCPQCKTWVEKISGCDHMTCRCKFQFCYACGGIYQKCACLKSRNQPQI
ncbi:unnamed protein product [Paramecium pentaurelia]|uniref:IBR domain-containing protein n=1 Tax=Paramecium pentaurelia TaxID=43138 RepID=A0A8S1YLS1_9CILI|nr:unnamed protein product [Paramecium pentaurelia]